MYTLIKKKNKLYWTGQNIPKGGEGTLNQLTITVSWAGENNINLLPKNSPLVSGLRKIYNDHIIHHVQCALMLFLWEDGDK